MDKETNIPSQTSEESATVGQFLKHTRLNQKKSVETVSKALCIRKIYIKAIEESDFKELPPVPYGIGFVRSYAEFLGLNSDRIVQCYKEEAIPQKKEKSQTASAKTPTAITSPNKKQILIGLCAAVVLYFLGVGIGHQFSKKPTEETPKTEPVSIEAPVQDVVQTPEVVSESSQVTMVEGNYEENTTPAEPEQQEDVSRVVVKFNGESWFEIRDKSKVYVSGIFQKGYVYNVPNLPNLIFSVGRYDNVEVYIDGKLTQVARPRKQTKINLDNFLNH